MAETELPPCDEQTAPLSSRRDFLQHAGVAAALTLGLAAGDGARAQTAGSSGVRAGSTGNAAGPYNIVFILTDQERFFRSGELPADYTLPAHERLKARGVS